MYILSTLINPHPQVFLEKIFRAKIPNLEKPMVLFWTGDPFRSHTIHVWHIYLHEWLIFMVNVGKYTIPAGHPGPSRRIFLSGVFLSPKRDPALKQSLAKSGRPAVVRRASASTFSDGFPVPEKKERSKPCHIRVFPKKKGYPKMDGENHGKPY